MPIPVALLLTREALNDVGHALTMKRLPRPAGGVLWDYLTEQGLLLDIRLRKLTKKPVPLIAHQWIVWDAVQSARSLKPGHPIALQAIQVAENWLREPTKENMEACATTTLDSFHAPSHNVIDAAISACMAVHGGMRLSPAQHAIDAYTMQQAEMLHTTATKIAKYHATHRCQLYIALSANLPPVPMNPGIPST